MRALPSPWLPQFTPIPGPQRHGATEITNQKTAADLTQILDPVSQALAPQDTGPEDATETRASGHEVENPESKEALGSVGLFRIWILDLVTAAFGRPRALGNLCESVKSVADF
jgi:hypothetical protein